MSKAKSAKELGVDAYLKGKPCKPTEDKVLMEKHIGVTDDPKKKGALLGQWKQGWAAADADETLEPKKKTSKKKSKK